MSDKLTQYEGATIILNLSLQFNISHQFIYDKAGVIITITDEEVMALSRDTGIPMGPIRDTFQSPDDERINSNYRSYRKRWPYKPYNPFKP